MQQHSAVAEAMAVPQPSSSSRGAVATENTLSVDVASGEVLRGGALVRVSDGTLQLLVLLAVSGRPMGRDAIIDRMWPDLDGDSAANALKVCAHRARAQLEDSTAITSRKGLFALGDGVTTNYQRILDLAAMAQSGTLSDAARKELPAIYERLARGLLSRWASWTWFVPHARALTDAARAMASSLVSDQLERGEFQFAQQTARALIAAEPFDENARMLILRVYMKSGNFTGAVEEYQEFARLLERELGEKPSADLKRALEAETRSA